MLYELNALYTIETDDPKLLERITEVASAIIVDIAELSDASVGGGITYKQVEGL